MTAAWDALEKLMIGRRSVREYSPEPVCAEEIRRIVALATLAPSGQNRQPWDFVAATSREKIAAMASAVAARVSELSKHVGPDNSELFEKYRPFFTFFETAPCVIAVFAKEYSNIRMLFPGLPAAPDRDTTHIQSASAAVMSLLLAASARGLASCWITNALVAKDEISALLGARKGFELVCLVSVGHPKAGVRADDSGETAAPAGIPGGKKRLDLSKVLRIV